MTDAPLIAIGSSDHLDAILAAMAALAAGALGAWIGGTMTRKAMVEVADRDRAQKRRDEDEFIGLEVIKNLCAINRNTLGISCGTDPVRTALSKDKPGVLSLVVAAPQEPLTRPELSLKAQSLLRRRYDDEVRRFVEGLFDRNDNLIRSFERFSRRMENIGELIARNEDTDVARRGKQRMLTEAAAISLTSNNLRIDAYAAITAMVNAQRSQYDPDFRAETFRADTSPVSVPDQLRARPPHKIFDNHPPRRVKS